MNSPVRVIVVDTPKANCQEGGLGPSAPQAFAIRPFTEGGVKDPAVAVAIFCFLKDLKGGYPGIYLES